ncbi:MAG: hypothetical protein KZQ63_04135, partial [Candidatus Thiodiazotropha sp. (ex Lucinoma aequizonata)]|nr:hypothetical protein [Candidatus Thiodiazotropha sp. (ex Lucinoma aequizonata)]
NSACINNEARYNQARQYGFPEKMSFLPGTNYYISIFYNSQRLHSYLGYMSLNNYEKQLLERKKAA